MASFHQQGAHKHQTWNQNLKGDHQEQRQPHLQPRSVQQGRETGGSTEQQLP
jgi:hypothetical protein